MSESRAALSRRVVVLGGVFAVTTAGAAHAQLPNRADKLYQWVKRIENEQSVKETGHGLLLGFPYDAGAGRQVALTRSGVQRVMIVIAPFQPGRLVLSASDPAKKLLTLHRTDVDLRRLASARDVAGKSSAWSGPECEADFAAQLDFWINEPVV